MDIRRFSLPPPPLPDLYYPHRSRRITIATRKEILLGTRGSRLALAQSQTIADALARANPGLAVRLEIISTAGDREADTPLAAASQVGFFTRELQTALLDRRIDLAVHSLKDLPTETPAGLRLAPVVPLREDPRDVLIARNSRRLADLPPGARVGTASLRRRVQLAALRPDLLFADIRGNIDTRLRKVRDGQFDAVVLARAGLARAGLLPADAELLDFDRMLPAPGQGALGLEIRADDAALADFLAPLDHPPSRLAVAAERALLGRLEAGCHAPVAALAQLEPDAAQLHLVAFLATPDGRRSLRDQLTGPALDAAALGLRLADRLLAHGAAEFLNNG